MSVFKFHQALALADYMGKQQQSLNFELTIKKEDLKPDTYSPLRENYRARAFYEANGFALMDTSKPAFDTEEVLYSKRI